MLKWILRTFWIGLLIVGSSIVSTKPALAISKELTPKELTPDMIFKKYKDAVVRIEVSLHGASLGIGSGFFVTNSGEIATSLHVIRPYLVHPDTDIKVKLANGKVFRSIKIGACSDTRGVDLCLLKIDHNPASLLPLAPVDVTPGESIVAIGHPRSLDFSISTGIVSALRSHPAGWNEVQIDAAISPGNSGGPIINRHGQAIGVVYQFERDGQNLNFGILTPEIQKLRAAALPFLAIDEARKDFSDRSKRLAKRAADKWIKPAIQSLNDIKLRPSGLKWMRAQLGQTSFLMVLPDLFQNCEKNDDGGETSSTSCSSSGGDIVVTIQKRPRSLAGSLASYRGRKLVESRPLAIVDRLEAEGTWEEAKAKQASFMSRPSAAKCFAVQKKNIVANDESGYLAIRKKGFFQDASALCRFITENDSEPGAISTSEWIEVAGDFYGINIWAADPGRLALLQGLSDLLIVSAGATSDEIRLPYRAKLRLGLKRDTQSPASSIPGADLNDSYSDDTSSVTIARTMAIAPAQMNRSFQKWAMTISKAAPQVAASATKSDVKAMEIAHYPGRIATWIIPHPADKKKLALFMMSASFGPNETWVLYEIQTLPPTSARVPAKSIVTDMDRFRDWVQEFEPIRER